MASSAGSLQLLAEHPSWTWTQAKSLGSKSAWTTLLQKDGFSTGDISGFLSGKLTAAELIAKKPATGQGNNTGVGLAVSQGASAVAGATGLSGVLSVFGFLTSPSDWLRVLEVVGGVILIAMGLRTLSGHDTTPISVTTGAAKGATKTAMRSLG